MAATWITVTTQSGSAWISVTQAVDDWQDPRLTELITEGGAYLCMENDGFLATEATATISSPWVPL